MNTALRHHNTRRCNVSCLLATASLLACAAARADDSPSVTPYRPSVSTPAALSAPGWLEIEAGAVSSRDRDASRSASLQYTFKLAFTPDWGVRLGGDALVRQTPATGPATQGGGDTTVVLKHRMELNDDQALGLELGTKFPTAGKVRGSGHRDTGLNFIYSADFAQGWHTDINLLATRIGGVSAGTGRWQPGWAGGLSRNLSAEWGAVVELSGTRQRGSPSTTLALAAMSYAVSKGLSLDFGASKGLSAASGGWSAFAGLTVLATRF